MSQAPEKRTLEKKWCTSISIVCHKAPVAYQVILEPGIGQFCDFESPRVHTPIIRLRLFLVHKLSCGKRESVS